MAHTTNTDCLANYVACNPGFYANNIFYDGIKCYSYGNHYLMSRLYPAQKMCLINSEGYSATTAKHQSQLIGQLVRSSTDWEIIRVPHPSPDTEQQHRENLDYLNAQITEAKMKLKRCRTSHQFWGDEILRRVADLDYYERSINQCIDYSQ